MIIFGYSGKGIAITELRRDGKGDARDLVLAIGQVQVPPCVDGLYRVLCTPAERRLVETSAHYTQLKLPVPKTHVLDLREDAGAFAVLGGALLLEQEAN